MAGISTVAPDWSWGSQPNRIHALLPFPGRIKSPIEIHWRYFIPAIIRDQRKHLLWHSAHSVLLSEQGEAFSRLDWLRGKLSLGEQQTSGDSFYNSPSEDPSRNPEGQHSQQSGHQIRQLI
jgi:hypothetical protein